MREIYSKKSGLWKNMAILLAIATLFMLAPSVLAADPPETQIEVVKKDRVAIIVFQPDKKSYWQSAKVTLQAEGKAAITKYTDGNGRAEFLMKDLLKNTKTDTYTYGALTISEPNCSLRMFEAAKVYLTGGEGRAIYLGSNPGTPYASSFTFDGEDMLMYRNGVYITKANDVQHTIGFKMCIQNDSAGTIKLCENGKVIASKEPVVQNGFATVEFTDLWCQKLHPGAKLSVQTEVGGKAYTFDAQLDIMAAVTTPVIAADNVDVELTNGSGYSDKALHEKFPVVGGKKVSYGLKARKFTMYIGPDGKVYMGNNMDLEPFRDPDTKNYDYNKWKTTSYRIFKNWARRENKRALVVFEASTKNMENRKRVGEQINDLFNIPADFELKMYAFAYGEGTYNPKTGKIEVALRDVREFKLAYDAKVSFKVGPIPCFAGFDFKIGHTSDNGLLLVSPNKATAPYKFNARYKDRDAVYMYPLDVGLSGGVLCPIASACIRGYASFLPKTEISQQTTKSTVAAGAGIEFRVEFDAWSKSFTIVDWPRTLISSKTIRHTATQEGDVTDAEILAAPEAFGAEYETEWVDLTTQPDYLSGAYDELQINAPNTSFITPVVDEAGTVRSDGYVLSDGAISYSSLGTHTLDVDCSATTLPDGQAGNSKPYSEKKVLENVLADSKSKVINVDDTPYLFRISACVVEGSRVNRLTYSKYTNNQWTTPVPVLTTVGSLGYTKDVYDYDFDVKTNYNEKVAYIVIALMAGPRGSSMEETQSKADLYAIRLTIDNATTTMTTTVTKPSRQTGTSISHPMAYVEDTKFSRYGCILQRTEGGRTQYGVSGVTTENGQPNPQLEFALMPCSGSWYDKPIVDAALGNGGTQGIVYLVEDGLNTNKIYMTCQRAAKKADWSVKELDAPGHVTCLQAVNSQVGRRSYFVGGYWVAVGDESGTQGKLFFLRGEDVAGNITYTFTDSGVTTGSPFFSATSFAALVKGGFDRGYYLYWQTGKEGKNLDGEAVCDYALHCARALPKGTDSVVLSEPYLVAKLGQSPDKLTAWVNDKGTLDAMYTHLHNIKQPGTAADLYYLQTRPVVELKLSALMAMEPCVGAGETTKMRVRVTNQGTVPAKGFTVRLKVEQTQQNLSMDFPELQTHLVLENGNVGSTEERDKLLVPGATHTYEGDVYIPSHYSGRINLRAYVNTVVAGVDSSGNMVAGSDGALYDDAFITVGEDNEQTLQQQFGYDVFVMQDESSQPACDLGFNDLAIEAERLNIGGVEYVKVFMQNLGDNVASGALMCSVDGVDVALDSVSPVTLNAARTVNQDDGGCVNVLLPLASLTGGRDFKSITFTLSGADEYDLCDNTYTIGIPDATPLPVESTTAGASSYADRQYTLKTNGARQADGSLLFAVDGARCDRFVSVTVDGRQLEKSEYTLTCDGVSIALHKDYLATLKDGEHILCIRFTDGKLETTFTTPQSAGAWVSPVLEIPATGGAGYALLALAAIGGAALLQRRRRVG